MGDVIKIEFCGHARASVRSRAAKTANVSAVNPASFAVFVLKTGSHHSAGMLSRCAHLRTATTPAPVSEAKVLSDGHSRTTSRNELVGVMQESLGQSVLNCKANLSYDCGFSGTIQSGMVKEPSKSLFKQEFMSRVTWAREAAGHTQATIAERLKMPQDKYKQYETRSFLPHDLIPQFCLLCRVNEAWLYTGYGLAPSAEREKFRKTKKHKEKAA